MSRPVDNNKNQPLDLAAFAETHQVNVSVVPVESPADARVRRGKDIALFAVALMGVLAVAGYCLYVLIARIGSADDAKWAAATLTAIVGGLLGYLTGRSQK